ncbi:MAG: hypothetical protein LUG18_15175, partial [Candidatus Azobacteroides sp.]|nr:hypothetical protein [Candidatus Azobacteroides sp.]
MRRMYLLLAVCLFLSADFLCAQERKNRLPLKLAEITKMVALDDNQLSVLKQQYKEYAAAMDSAIYKVEDKDRAAALIRASRQQFNTVFMNLLTGEQKEEYLRATTRRKDERLPLKLAEIARMTDLSETQLSGLKSLYKIYAANTDSAIYKTATREEAARLLYDTRQAFNRDFMNLLSAAQQEEYLQVTTMHKEEKLSQKLAEITRMVELEESQLALLK